MCQFTSLLTEHFDLRVAQEQNFNLFIVRVLYQRYIFLLFFRTLLLLCSHKLVMTFVAGITVAFRAAFEVNRTGVPPVVWTEPFTNREAT